MAREVVVVVNAANVNVRRFLLLLMCAIRQQFISITTPPDDDDDDFTNAAKFVWPSVIRRTTYSYNIQSTRKSVQSIKLFPQSFLEF